MEKRKLGKTNHMSSIITFGSAALSKVSQKQADDAIAMAIEHGVNHFDVAPVYGEAEKRLGPWMQYHHKEIFLACKTKERGKSGARESINRSLETLRVDYFDLFQFHEVNDLETLNVILGPMGALEAVLEAKEQGLVHHIGITGHRPFVYIEALKFFDFDTILFPVNCVLAAHPKDYNKFMPLIEIAQEKNVGTIAIKSVAKQLWESPIHMYRTWYEPFDTQEEVDRGLWYVLSQGVTTAALPSDLSLWPLVLSAAERFQPLKKMEQEEIVTNVKGYKPIFPNVVL